MLRHARGALTRRLCRHSCTSFTRSSAVQHHAATDVEKLARSLSSGLGITSSTAERLATTVAARQYPLPGALSRVAQMRHLVDVGALSATEARGIVEEQPEFLELVYRSQTLGGGRLILVDKPFHTRLTTSQSSSLPRDRSGPRFEGETTVQRHLEEAHPEALTSAGDARLCHNLDFATSGLLVAATSRATARAVARCFQTRTARKLYAALVHGHPAWERATWCEPIDVSGHRFAQHVAPHGGAGKPARTDVTVAARGVLRLGSSHRGRPATLLWLEPRTGRRHQLRVHCAHHGHPIVGDVSYAKCRLAYRTFLHAAALQLPLAADDVRHALSNPSTSGSRWLGPAAAPRSCNGRRSRLACAQVIDSVAPLSPAGWASAVDLKEEIRGPSSALDADGCWAHLPCSTLLDLPSVEGMYSD